MKNPTAALVRAQVQTVRLRQGAVATVGSIGATILEGKTETMTQTTVTEKEIENRDTKLIARVTKTEIPF